MTQRVCRFLAAWLLIACCTVSRAASSSSAIVATPLGQRLDQYLSRIEALGFAGPVLIAKDGKVILHKGYGLADREQRIAYSTESVFDIGSITKQFTAAAILKLEMAGKLRVEDSIAKYFEAVPEDKRGITLHHLLTHSSGLRGDFGDDYERISRDDLVTKALASQLQWAPGTRYDYSNAGYSLLGAIVEKVSGRPYEAFLQQQLFEPAGMTQTGYRIPKWQPQQLAKGYELDIPWGTPLDKPWDKEGPWWNLRANGGLLSTVGDLYQWHQALLGERILSKAAKAKYFAPHVAEDEEGTSHYGYGWVVGKTPRDTTLIQHNGGNGVFAADLQRFVDEDTAIIAGSARSDFQCFTVTVTLAALVFGTDVPSPPELAPTRVLDRYVGSYAFASGGTLILAPTRAASNGFAALSVVPDTRTTFEAMQGLVPPEVSSQLRGLEPRLLSALEQTRQGIYDPLAAIYGVPLDAIKQRFPMRISQLESRLGPFQRFDVLGTVARGQRVATWVRFNHQRGAQVFEQVWQESQVAQSRPVEGIGGSFFAAADGKELFSYDPRTLRMQRIAVEQAQDGAVTALVLKGASGEMRAVRR